LILELGEWTPIIRTLTMELPETKEPRMPKRHRTRSLRLIGESFLMWRRHRQSQLAPHRITLQQAHVLAQLERHERLHPSDIADMLFCDRPTASTILRNLERKGWISRTRDPANRKFAIVKLSRDGAEKLNTLRDLAPFASDPFDPLGCFDSNEVALLESLLGKLHKHLKTIPQ